ncbi:hypothetical protein [Francisella adeliensis]|uniref:GP-PDE domain-containing protein n=1 Tax=Francisella adeliensis TaxID=2007306 RepID=A0A2Z4XXU5_9GAMM|nr:hypothetical protein [Francisella adeliensis]AXA33599.1 hypothetical protein CDH04_03875 [Francisella adeliensis]MBK2085158.1 hypothetical protein [Francisella adeliensis]MBK2097365.1 hypothetical protein [Francisella adeliensis]QIW11831.1 hypothetical protein FZC43_03875 [Francisella adeliensis]QIW13707.1 hypothetical protein FZC44_03875 [Francisella adeliensis]
MSSKNSFYSIAHQVNKPENISKVLPYYSGLEIDIAYSASKKQWVVAHHDFNNTKHYSLEDWLTSFKQLYSKRKSKLSILWLDIKTLDDNNIKDMLSTINKHIPKNISIIYDLGRPLNIINKNFSYKNIINNLREIDGIGCWITKEDLNLVSKVKNQLITDKVKNTIISYGEVVDIDLEVLYKLCEINKNLQSPFSKVFVWNIQYIEEIDELIAWQEISGMIIGYKKQMWNDRCLDQLKYLNDLKVKFNRNTPTTF